MVSVQSLIKMIRRFLISDQSLFHSPELFEFDYMPEQVLFRENQLAELAFRIRPGMEGMSPGNAICRGPPGSGKTTSVKHLFSEIREATRRILPIYLNCQTDQTKYAIYSRIFAMIAGHAPPRTGVSTTTLMDVIAKAVLDRNAVLLVCLDDVQYLIRHDTVNAVIYSLLRMHLDYPGCRAGVIMTTSEMQLDFSRIFDPGVSSTLCADEIPFPPYTADEISEILSLRVREGVMPGVISSDVLDQIVRKTEKTGDLRIGLDLLKRSILRAMREGRGSVLREDILLAYGEFRLLHLAEMIQRLSEEERALLLLLIRTLTNTGGEALTSGEMYGYLIEEEEISYPVFWDRLETLAEIGLIDLRIRQSKGRTDVITPRYSREEVEGICRA